MIRLFYDYEYFWRYAERIPERFDAIHAAAYWGLDKILRFLPPGTLDLDSQDTFGKTALLSATQHGHKSTVLALLELGADIETKNDKYVYTPLYRAVIDKNEPMARLLLEKGANVEARDHIRGTILCQAVLNHDERIVRLLLEHGADIEGRSEEPRHTLTICMQGKPYGDGAVAARKGGRSQCTRCTWAQTLGLGSRP